MKSIQEVKEDAAAALAKSSKCSDCEAPATQYMHGEPGMERLACDRHGGGCLMILPLSSIR